MKSDEEFLKLSEAANLCPGRPSASCLWRWCRQGVKSRSGQRIRLEHRRVGGRIYVRKSDLNAFFEQLARSDLRHFEQPRPCVRHHNHGIRTASQRHAALEDARSSLGYSQDRGTERSTSRGAIEPGEERHHD